MQDTFLILRRRTRTNTYQWRVIIHQNATLEELELATQLRRDLSPARQVPKFCTQDHNAATNPVNRYERIIAGLAERVPKPGELVPKPCIGPAC